LVFSSPPDRLALEAITHPLVGEEVARRLSSARTGGAGLVVIELPLLGAARRNQYKLDVVVFVDAPVEHALARAVARGMAEADARARMSVQPSQDERRAMADRVVMNANGPAELDAEVGQLWEWLEGQRVAGHAD
jgi:dephospho-CoA kinase